MAVPEELRDAIKRRYNADDVKIIANPANGEDEVHAYGMLPDMTITGWYPLGDLDELEKRLQDNGEL